MRRPGRAVVLALAAVGLLTACSGSSDETSDSSADTLTTLPTECAPAAPSVKADRIADAVAAVEAERGGPQQYFEINATGLLVNLFVADTAAGQVVPYVWVEGALSNDDPQPATGNTFAASALDFNPQLVTSCVAASLPASSIDRFLVEGGPNGAVRYSVVTTSPQGGQLVVEVAGDGKVLSVDPN